MNGLQFAAHIRTLSAPVLFWIVSKTEQKISKKIFGEKVYKVARTACWVNFHLKPEKFTESEDPTYFRLPSWGIGNYPVFSHSNGSEYIGLLPKKLPGNFKKYVTESGEEIPENTIRMYLPPKQEEMDGYPIYFNIKVESVLFAEPYA